MERVAVESSMACAQEEGVQVLSVFSPLKQCICPQIIKMCTLAGIRCSNPSCKFFTRGYTEASEANPEQIAIGQAVPWEIFQQPPGYSIMSSSPLQEKLMLEQLAVERSNREAIRPFVAPLPPGEIDANGNTPRVTVPLEQWPRIREVRPAIDNFSEGGKLCFLLGEEEPAASEVMGALPHDDSQTIATPKTDPVSFVSEAARKDAKKDAPAVEVWWHDCKDNVAHAEEEEEEECTAVRRWDQMSDLTSANFQSGKMEISLTDDDSDDDDDGNSACRDNVHTKKPKLL
jgi:hypothetical protein